MRLAITPQTRYYRDDESDMPIARLWGIFKGGWRVYSSHVAVGIVSATLSVLRYAGLLCPPPVSHTA